MSLETNVIYCGDNLEVMAKFPPKSVDLIYADPPFFSNKHYEIIWGNGAEMKVYEDRWKGGINVYIEWMEPRIAQCHRILKDKGSIYLHCDWHASAHLKTLMDRIFGERNFRNEIIWQYESGGRATNFFSRKHDNIYFYSKTKDYTFNPDDIAIPRNQCERCHNILEKWNHLKKHTDKNGRVYRTILSNGKVYRYYDDEKVPPSDVWMDISHIQQKSPERLGYPTQKPELLLTRIIRVGSGKNDIVLDPFAGGGTTLAVAHQLGREWIGIDVSPIACKRMKDRLEKIGAENIHVIGAPKTIKELKKLSDWQFQNWVVDRIGGTPSTKKGADKGIDGFTFMAREPIQVKQSEHIGRNIVDNFETAIRREQKTSGYIFAFSFGKGAYEEAARAKLDENLDIKLIRIDEMDEHF